jgi:hypothetical protein
VHLEFPSTQNNEPAKKSGSVTNCDVASIGTSISKRRVWKFEMLVVFKRFFDFY